MVLENNGWVCKCWCCGKDYYNYDIMDNFYCDDCRKAMGIKPVNATTQVEIQDLGFGVIKETYKRDNNSEAEAIKEMARDVERAAVSIDDLWEKFDKEHPGWRERGVEQLCDKNRKLTEQNEKLKKKVKRLTKKEEINNIAFDLMHKDFTKALNELRKYDKNVFMSGSKEMYIRIAKDIQKDNEWFDNQKKRRK